MNRKYVTGTGLILLGLGAATLALLGPLVLGIIDWRVSSNAAAQLLGGDVATLFLAAPLAVLAGILWLRDHALAPVLTLGPAIYGLYTFSSLIFGVGYDRYDGNNEYAIPLVVVLIILAWGTAAMAWSGVAAYEVPAISDTLRRVLAWSLIIIAGLFVVAWSGQIAQVLTDTGSLQEYNDDPATFWTIKTLDLAFVMPVAILAGVGLLRRNQRALRATYALVGFFALMSAAVTAMGVAMLIQSDPSATYFFPVITGVATLLFMTLSTVLYRSYVDSHAQRPSGDVDGAVADTDPSVHAHI